MSTMNDDMAAKITSLEQNVASMTKKLDIALEALASFTAAKPPILSLTNKDNKSQGENDDNLSPLYSPKPLALLVSNERNSGSSSSKFTSFSEGKTESVRERDKKNAHFTPPQSTWIKLFSDKKAKYFFFNPITKKVVWEVQKLDAKTKHGDCWEKVSYVAEGQGGGLKCIFLDPKTGDVQDDEPINKDTIVPAFDPGEYDPEFLSKKSTFGSSSNESSLTETGKGNNGTSSDKVGGGFNTPDKTNITLANRDSALSTTGGGGTGVPPSPKVDKAHRRKTLGDLFSRRISRHSKQHSSDSGEGGRVVGEGFEDGEEEDYEYVPCMFMFDPHEFKRLTWDFAFILPCLMYLTVMMPYRLCFSHEAQGTMLLLETMMDIIFIIDILVNFRTGYYVQETGMVEFDQKKAALRYLKTWFALDVISGIPFALFDNVSSLDSLSVIKILKVGRVAKAARLLSFLKLSKIAKTTKVLSKDNEEILERIEDVMTDVTTRSALSMLKIMLMISLVVHFMACLWVLIGRIGDIEGKENWLIHDNYTGNEDGFTHRDTTGGPKTRTIYIASYYYCYTTISSVGYGDIHPYNNNERIFCVILEACGGFMYAIIIAALTSIATSTDTNKRAVRERLDMVSSYVRNKKFPDHLSRRIIRYFRHFFEAKTAIDEQLILSDLPTDLRHEVSTFLISDLMASVTLFKTLEPSSWSRILPLLRPCRFEGGTLICSQGEHCTEAFILLEGEMRAVTVVDPNVGPETLALLGLKQPSVTKAAKPGGLRNSALSPSSQRASASAKIGGAASPSNATSSVKPSRTASIRGLRLPQLHFSEHVESKKHADERKSLVNQNSLTQEEKAVEQPLTPLEALDKFASQENSHCRVLSQGSMVNTLCLMHIWEKCLETVVATENCECYAINAVEFRRIFTADDDDFKDMRERLVYTSFSMYQIEQGDAHGLEFGVPLYMFPEAEIEFRTEAYTSWKSAKKEQFAQALRKHEAEKAMVLAIKKTKAMNRFARAFRSKTKGGGGGGGGGGSSKRVFPDLMALKQSSQFNLRSNSTSDRERRMSSGSQTSDDEGGGGTTSSGYFNTSFLRRRTISKETTAGGGSSPSLGPSSTPSSSSSRDLPSYARRNSPAFSPPSRRSLTSPSRQSLTSPSTLLDANVDVREETYSGSMDTGERINSNGGSGGRRGGAGDGGGVVDGNSGMHSPNASKRSDFGNSLDTSNSESKNEEAKSASPSVLHDEDVDKTQSKISTPDRHSSPGGMKVRLDPLSLGSPASYGQERSL